MSNALSKMTACDPNSADHSYNAMRVEHYSKPWGAYRLER